MSAEQKTGREDAEAEVWSAIEAFEQILQADPEDRVALETLHSAYEKIGDHSQALSYLIRLANVVASDQDSNAAGELIAKLQKTGGDSDDAQAAAQQLKKLTASAPAAEPKAPPKAAKPKRRRAVDITHEMSLAWNLLQAEEIGQEDYNDIVHDLTENSTRNVQSPITVLHVLHDRQFKGLTRVMTYLSRDSGMPIISLSTFELQEKTFKLLPPEYMIHRGALCFEIMAGDALIAVLNPYDVELQKDVEEELGRPCHFYLVGAEDYETALGNIRAALKASEQKPA